MYDSYNDTDILNFHYHNKVKLHSF